MPDLFNMMVEQGILDKNLFTLKLPRGVLWQEKEGGELTLREIPKALPEANITRIPLLDDTESPLSGYWASEIRSLSMGMVVISMYPLTTLPLSSALLFP
ncbi:hypothetical protein AOQ84DRAFT_424084 [Glonium stellatum]|uniref:Uncharacterized protein n=1 Tax=Glonium stellatum TaxID=574774 RepID=A0A8E2JM48_9PEZI|nr:hypothetical protein AOQ84DRAFT_424084 [Glonium stellatum]